VQEKVWIEMKSVVVTGWNDNMCMKDFDVIYSSLSVLVINPFTEISFFLLTIIQGFKLSLLPGDEKPSIGLEAGITFRVVNRKYI
jgi:hypothetical protein